MHWVFGIINAGVNHRRKVFQHYSTTHFGEKNAGFHFGHVIDIHPHTPARDRCHHVTIDASDGWQRSRLVIVVNH